MRDGLSELLGYDGRRRSGRSASRGRLRRGWVGALVAAVLSASLVAVAAEPASAHGTPDQGTPNEACSAAEYPGAKLVTGGESRQSFTPTRGGVSGVDLCIQNLVGLPGTDFTVTIYEDTPDGPVALGSVPHDAGGNLLAAQWVHVDFPAELPTTPGGVYLLGVAPAHGAVSAVTFQWRSTCSDGLLSSCAGVEDAYPAGSASDLPGNADYAFRTFPEHEADLTGAVEVSTPVCPGLDLTDRATGSVTNVSETAVGAFDVQWLWSTDASLDPEDVVLGDLHHIDGLDAGADASVPPPTLPTELEQGEGYLLLQVDVGGAILESDDLNNLAAASATVIGCGQPDFTDLTLTVDEDDAPAGFNEVQFDDLDRRALASLPQSRSEVEAGPGFAANGFSANGFSANGFSANGFSANGFSANGFSANGFSANGFSANGFSANGFSANGFSPAEGVSLADVLGQLPTGFADRILVVDVPIAGEGWVERLAPFTSEPIQNITLARASSLLPDLRLGEVDLTRVLHMTWMALALIGGDLADLPLPDGQTWCQLQESYGFDCLDPATTSLLELEAAGFPSHQAPVADLRLSDITVDDDLLVLDLPLTGEPRFNLEHTRLGGMPVEEALTDPSAVVDCGAFDCSQSLAAAAAAGALRNGTVRDLVAHLSDAGRDGTLVGDLALGTAALNSLHLSSANWNLANAYLMDESCPAITYRLTGSNVGDGTSVDPMAAVTLPAGFVYVPGTVAVTADGAPAGDQGEPTEAITPNGVRTYTFPLDAEIAGSFELTFSACASVYLGYVDAGTATVSGSGIDGPYSATTGPSEDSVRVVERTPGATTRALEHEDNIVVADHISAANGHDVWTFPVKPEPGTMYIVKLFNPLGVDLDLIGYGPAVSANGFSANGFSANGFSANGFSANGFSANGFSANGFSANGFSANGFSANGFSATASSDVNDDLPIEELRPSESRGHLVSSHRGDETETIYAFSTFGDEGELSFAVVDYAGTRTDAPYVMTLQTVRPTRNPILDTCDAAPWDLTQAPGAAPAAWSGTSGPKTLFVTNRQVAASVHGAAATDAGLAALAQLAARPEVRGMVVNADHHPDVRAAYAGWRSDWCNPTAANIAASHVRSLILGLRELHPSIDTVVLVGGDEVVPDFRLSDGSVLANENQYTEALIKATGGNNALVAAYAHGTLPSADPYGNEAPLPFGMTLAFPPSAGVSRLIETPADWIAQRDQYVAANGRLNPADGLVTGYDGMVDGAEAAASVLRGAGVPTSTLTDASSSWSADDFRRRAFTETPDAAGYNAHANHFAILSDQGSDTDDPSELVTSDELGDLPFGGFIFSNGCHFGTSVPDALNRDPSESERDRLLDWNQSIAQRRGIAVTNTGFGIFDTEEVGQGERLQALFLERLRSAPNAALALAQAKNEFLATVGVHDAYSFKTLQQLAMYGLGILSMSDGTAPPPAPPAGTNHLDVTAGTYSVASSPGSTCTRCYLARGTDSGIAIDLRDPDAADTGHTASNGYWSAPLSVRKLTLPPGKLSAGLWFNGLKSHTLSSVDAVTTRLAVNRPDRELESQTAGPFPTSLGTVYDVAGQAVVTLLHGISQPMRKEDGRVVSDLSLYTDIDVDVLLRPAGTVGSTPIIDEVTVVRPTPESNLLVIDVLAPGANQRAAVLAQDDLGNWTYRELGQGANGHWTTSIALPAGATEIRDLHVQVSNGLGVGHWRNKGDRPLIRTAAADGVEVALDGTQHESGVFRGTVIGTIVGRPGIVYSVYDNDRHLGDLVAGDAFEVIGDGSHDIVVDGSDGSSWTGAVAIDASPPAIVWRSPADGAVYTVGAPAVLDASCVDAGTGASCTATVNGNEISVGDPLPTGQAGTYHVVINAEDGVGEQATSSRTYTVQAPVPKYTISPFFSPIKPKPQLNDANGGSTITLKFTVKGPDGTEYKDPAIIKSRTWQMVNCASPTVAIGPVFTASGTTPTYSGYFHFNVSAPNTVGCYELVVTLEDGTRAGAYFRVSKKR